MNDTHSTGSASTGAAAELADIRRRQQRAVKAALVPVWCWWAMAPALVAIGAARDSHDAVVLAITIPLAVLVMAGAVIASLPEVRRRVRVHRAAQPGGRAAAALTGLILLIIAVTIAVAVGLVDNHVAHPLTIAYAAGAAVLVTVGPVCNRYLGRLMLTKAAQPITDEPEPRPPWTGLLSSDPGPRPADNAGSSSDGATQ
jgi:peptidoglycan/LPS O-acetylase OafA/YrhL